MWEGQLIGHLEVLCKTGPVKYSSQSKMKTVGDMTFLAGNISSYTFGKKGNQVVIKITKDEETKSRRFEIKSTKNFGVFTQEQISLVLNHILSFIEEEEIEISN